MDDAIKSSVYVTSPEFAGYLMKKGFRWRKVWKKRWVALHGMEIVYMDKEPTSKNMADITITKAQFNGASCVKEEDPDNDPTGFAIHINDGKNPPWYLRAEDERQRKLWVLRLSYALAIVKWLHDFEKVRVLGVGGTGIVYELLHNTNGSRFAMKEMEIKTSYQMQMAVSEAEMLKDIMENVSHPNIMHIERVFQVGSKFYLVFPMCFGGELYEHIIKRGHFTEHDAATISRDLVSGLHALHEHDILHLDIKPENILFDSMDPEAKVKITDFGLSKRQTKEEAAAFDVTKLNADMAAEMRSFQLSGDLTNDRRMKGTIGYMSPELLLINHTSRAADVFAAGVVVYILLSGMPPFQGSNDRDTINKTIVGECNMNHEVWESISDEAKDLVKRMLHPNPFQRITTAQILKHPWLQQLDEEEASELAPLGTPGKNGPGKDGIAPLPVAGKFSKGVSTKRSGINLAGTLRHLSGHVKQRRSEKLATNVTRLVSMMQQGQGKSTLADIYLIGKEDDAAHAASKALTAAATGKAKEKEDESEDYMMLMNTELREAFTNVIDRLTAHNLPLAIEKMGLSDDSGNEPSSPPGSVPRRLSRRASHKDMVDSEGRNISLDQQVGFTIEQFVTILVYMQFNNVNPGAMADNSPKNHFGALVFSRFLDRDGDGFITLDDISTVQALMMQKSHHFVKMVFRLYSEVLWYPGRQLNIMNMLQGSSTGATSATAAASASTAPTEGSSPAPPPPPSNKFSSIFSGLKKDKEEPKVLDYKYKVLEGSNGLPKDVVEPPKFITGKHVAAIFEKLGFDASCGQKVFNVLVEAVNRSDTSDALLEGVDEDLNEEDMPGRQSEFVKEGVSGKGGFPEMRGSESDAGGGGAAGVNQKMDVKMFIKAAELDDVLLQAIWRRPRGCLRELMQNARTKAAAGGYKKSVAEVIEEELLAVLEPAMNSSKGSADTPGGRRNRNVSGIGAALGRAAMGLAGKIVEGAQSLKSDIEES